MRVRLLGGLEVEGVASRDLGSRKARTLLKVLALARGRPVSVDRLADVLWGDEQPARPADQVGVLVSRLRAVLGPGRIRRTDAGYVLVTDWLDLDELDRLVAVAAEARTPGRMSVVRAAAGTALVLARGPLLPDDDGEWVEVERAAVRAAVTRVRRLAVDAAVSAGDYGGAAALGEQALADDPYDEVVLRAVMESHLAAGRPASALAAYARIRERLAEDLGVPPTAATEALHARVLAAADGAGGAPPELPPARAAVGVVGRIRELAVLDAALRVAAGGGVALVVVEGDAGIGKTVLVEAWSQVARGDAVVLWGRCDALGRDLPLQPVADALADHLRVIGVERAAAVVGDEATTLAPLLGPLTGAPATVVVDAEAGQARVFAALVGVLSRAGSGKPVVLVIDDLHIAGASTLAWIAFTRRRAQRVLVVVTARSDGAKRLDATHHIRLGPLDLDAVTELVGTERAETLYERSGGHPLLLAALAASEGEELPATLAEAVSGRVDSLGDEVAATVRVAAVLGPDCDLELVAQVTSTAVVEVLSHLEAAERAGLVVERGSRFGFRHELVRAALEVGTGAARRALVHQRAARALAGRAGVDPLAVAVHARAGGDDALAARWFVAASEVAAGRFDPGAAEDHATAALDLVATPEAYAARARARSMSRLALELAAADAERAVGLGGGAPALEVAGWVAYYQRRHDDARRYADEAAARATDSGVRISALALAGRVRHAAGDLAGAVERLSGVGDGPPAVRGVAEVWLAQARVHQGRPTDALAVLAGPMTDPDNLAHPWAPLHLRFTRILALGQLGRVSDALTVAADLDAAVARAGPVGARYAGAAANAGAWILRWSGRGEEADDRNRWALEVTGGDAGPAADALTEAYYVALLDLADGALLGDDVVEVAALVARLAPLDTWRGTMAWHQRHRLGLLRARLALAAGDRETAAHLASAVSADAAARGAGRYELLARAVLGLADPALPTGELAAVVDGLGRCAVLDGWPLIAALAAARRSDSLWAEAERRAGVVVANAGDHAGTARRFVARFLRD